MWLVKSGFKAGAMLSFVVLVLFKGHDHQQGSWRFYDGKCNTFLMIFLGQVVEILSNTLKVTQYVNIFSCYKCLGSTQWVVLATLESLKTQVSTDLQYFLINLTKE